MLPKAAVHLVEGGGELGPSTSPGSYLHGLPLESWTQAQPGPQNIPLQRKRGRNPESRMVNERAAKRQRLTADTVQFECLLNVDDVFVEGDPCL